MLLRDARSVLVVDWPSPDVPDALLAAGYEVFVKGGPGPRDYAVRERSADGSILSRPVGEAPAGVDLVYAHRPLAELDGLIAMAVSLQARALWWQSGLSQDGGRDPYGCWVSPAEAAPARAAAEAAGLQYVDDVYVGDAVRALATSAPSSDR